MKRVILTKDDAQEVAHKLGVLADNEDGFDGYGLTASQAADLVRLVPANGGEFAIPPYAEKAVAGEIADHCLILDDQARAARSDRQNGDALRIAKQAKRLRRLFVEEANA